MQLIGQKIRAAREARELTQQKVADHFGIRRNSVSLWETEDGKPEQAKLTKLAEILSVPINWLLDDGMPVTPIPSVDNFAAPLPHTQHSDILRSAPFQEDGEDRIPVLGLAKGGENGEFLLNGETIEYVRRPVELAGVKNAYSLYVSGDSMEPRYFEGERINVHPSRPAVIGDFVVVQLHPNVTGEPKPSFVKRLKRKTSVSITLEQYNPPKEIVIEQSKISTIHVILGSRS